jgi:prolyl-tRNA synthetase
MRTRLLLRTTEFLWQEGHTAHASEQEAREETERMLGVYATFAEEWMAIPVLRGAKTPSERFAGAVDTLCIEALMQDGKALQAGTSHFLGQNFARAFDCTFQNSDNEQEYVWATSWGVSTRLIGAMVMVHGDDRGLVLPPRLAPTQVAIVPIWKSDDERTAVREASETLATELREAGVRVLVDAREQYRPGWKFTEYEVQGVPLRIAIGPRDLQNGVVELARRHSGDKSSAPRDGLVATVKAELEAGQTALFDRALALRKANTHAVDSYDDFKAALDAGGFVLAHWDRDEATEARIKDETRATIRCLPFPGQVAGSEEAGTDPVSGQPSPGRVVFARAY